MASRQGVGLVVVVVGGSSGGEPETVLTGVAEGAGSSLCRSTENTWMGTCSLSKGA